MTQTFLSIETLHELFDYSNGDLIWKVNRFINMVAGKKAGCKSKADGYIRVGIDNRNYLLHRLVYAWHTGQWPKYIDHADRDRNNNRIENLRPLDSGSNRVNTDIVRNKYGLKGISLHKKSGRYQASINIGGKKVSLKYHDTPEEAHQAYIHARDIYYPGVYEDVKCI